MKEEGDGEEQAYSGCGENRIGDWQGGSQGSSNGESRGDGEGGAGADREAGRHIEAAVAEDDKEIEKSIKLTPAFFCGVAVGVTFS